MKWQTSILLLALLFFGSAGRIYALPPSQQNPLSQEIYIWQRSWNEPVRQALQQHASEFSGVVALNAEVTWKKRVPQLIRVPVDYEALRTVKTKVGLALRIGVFPGPFGKEDAATRYIENLAQSLVTEARSNQLAAYELHIDFDCAESKLEGYQVWVEAIRKRVAPLPVVITALPSWLNQPSFASLAKASDGFILQVHSFERPKDFNAPFQLCDVTQAKKSIAKAGQIGVPFRVALPTYGYLAAFSGEGKFLGLSAEGPARNWPAEARVREVCADSNALAGLVNELGTNRPAALRGIFWYRMPISLDVLNWSWPTLQAVMAGRPPRESSRVETKRPEPGLVEISLVNDGEVDLSSRPVIEIRWQNARLVASDGLRDFEAMDINSNKMQFRPRSNAVPRRIASGERLPAGWLRLSGNVEVQVETKKP